MNGLSRLCGCPAWPALPEEEREIVAIDGKTSRGSASPGLAALHTVNVFSVQHNIVLSAAGVPEKTNEIKVLPELIRVIAPVGAITTTDAMGCKKDVARAVREVPGADYLLALKKNHPRLEAEIAWLFDHHDQDGWIDTDSSFALTQNSGHGRTETWECRLIRIPANPLYFLNHTKNLTPFWSPYFLPFPDYSSPEGFDK